MRGNPPPLTDPESFRQLYSRTYLLVYRYIYASLGGPVQEVEDMTAETFSRAWKTRQRFGGSESAALGWLLTIARNLMIDAYRRKRTNPPPFELETDDLDFRDEHTGPEEKLIDKERLEILLAAMQRLPPEQRELLVLRYVLGWQVKQIAVHLDMLENTVSVYLRRSLQNLREQWPEEIVD